MQKPLGRRRLLRNTAVVAAVGGAVAGGIVTYRTVAAAPTDPAAAIAQLVADTVPDGAGATVLAAMDDELVYRAGSGESDRAAGIPAGRTTVYDIGSVSKQFTGAALMKLHMGGEVDLDDPLTAYFPRMRGDQGDITLHQLLTHTSGLIDALGDDYEALSRDDMLDAVNASQLLAAPGSQYHYSNAGYSVLAALIEEISGDSYEEYLATELFAPAGMTNTGYLLPDWDAKRIAVEYDPDGSVLGRPNEQPWDDDGPYWNLRGNGGILSTVDDMYAWHRGLLTEDILSSDAKRLMFEPHVAEDDATTSHYGYGWAIFEVDDTTVVWHNGGNGASYAEMLHVPGGGPMVFWATNSAQQDGEWNLEEADLSVQIAEILVSA